MSDRSGGSGMDADRDLERFAVFVAAAAGAAYHAPPETPRDALWERIAGALEDVAAGDAGAPPAPGSDEELVSAAAGYHTPPVPPHDEMWGRVEAAWEMRRAAPVEARQAGLETLPESPWGAEERSGRRRSLARWGTAVAIAASLVMGIALGRTTLAPAGDAGSVVATGSPDGPVRAVSREAADGTDMDRAGRGSALLVPEPRDALAAGPLETAGASDLIETIADETGPVAAASPTGGRDASTSAGGSAAAGGAARFNVAVRLATARYLGQAESLLTTFRAEDPEPGDETPEVSGWARDLLGDTRLLLDLPVERTPREVALLEELELVLAQIAQLGPDAPTFEREIVADGLVRQGTIARLRAATPPGDGAAIGM